MSAGTFVGLDLSLTGTGFAVLKDDKFDKIMTIKTNPKTAENDLARLQHIRETILGNIPEGVSLIAVEDFFIPHSALQMNAAISLIKLGTCIRLALYEKGYKFVIVSPNSLKKHLTGKGVSQKGMMMKVLFQKHGIDTKDDNQADACALCYLAKDIFTGDAKFDYQKEVVQKINADSLKYN